MAMNEMSMVLILNKTDVILEFWGAFTHLFFFFFFCPCSSTIRCTEQSPSLFLADFRLEQLDNISLV